MLQLILLKSQAVPEEEMKMLQLVLILLVLSGVFTQDSKWGVKYPDKPICAVRGFSVSIKCSYYYPRGHQVIQKLWCSMNLNTDLCKNPPYVYDSSLNTKSDFDFTGDDKSDCTLLIHNVQFSYSGVYRFRFITDVTRGKLTGYPGATLQVTDLKVSLIRLSGNGTLKQGDSLNLTCDVSCTHTSSQFVWSKNNQSLYTSGPVLHFPALTLRDSGNYTCTWGTGETSGSETISLHVEDDDTEHSERLLMLVIACVTTGVIVVITGAVIHKRRSMSACFIQYNLQSLKILSHIKHVIVILTAIHIICPS
ncbi:myeloid cell surface antigen CD33-like isoform X1 [Tachysurus fulvidraco]|uniref:myeloid cell surface antigen CD33-like isoform X1 n=1 Tax=Tachysurus fulvidraco TaxID=1234273 RepID=UPI001FEE4CE5|nr:myeloid cell surface antigen CD33-like isoform X1 [Tachysurus fulvidraco]